MSEIIERLPKKLQHDYQYSSKRDALSECADRNRRYDRLGIRLKHEVVKAICCRNSGIDEIKKYECYVLVLKNK